MLRRRLVALSVCPLLATGLLSASQPAEAVSAPSSISTVTAVPGARPGEVQFSWATAGAHTHHFLLETGLTAFSKSSSSSLPTSGRNAKTFIISNPRARSYTLTADEAASAGAPLGSANYLYYRLYAVNQEGSKTVTKAYPNLQAVLPQALGTARSKNGTDLRVGTFNVRTVKATKDKRNWLKRVDDVANEILTSRAGVVLLQEISPGRADGKGGSTAKVGRQTTSLLAHLAKQGGKDYDYKMNRTTLLVKTGVKRGTQGGRVLYDNKRYKLISSCPEKTGKTSYNPSCSFKLPIASGDGESQRRRGSYALLENRKTGQRFYAVSAHLDPRHSSSKTNGPKYNNLRAAQARYLVSFMKSINPKNYPVVFGADMNTWQSDKSGYTAHDVLVAGGFYDTAAAKVRVNEAFNTSNGFATTLSKSAHGYGPHLDVVMVKGGKGGADQWVNVLQNPDSDRPSDHNLVWADIRI
jgi:endonuclease/exonuclease/phosphatase family metal-dependent hydrolase